MTGLRPVERHPADSSVGSMCHSAAGAARLSKILPTARARTGNRPGVGGRLPEDASLGREARGLEPVD